MSELDPALWRDLVGLPFVIGARGPHSFDCYGLVLEVYRRRGIDLVPHPTPQVGAIEAAMRQALGVEWRRIADPTPGCLLAFRDRGAIGHVGVFLGLDRFIHAAESRQQVLVERLAATRSFLPLIGAYEPV